MASGYGVRGSVGRCYPIFSALNQCVAQAEKREDCTDFNHDYFECLHHLKEAKKHRAIEEERGRHNELLEHVLLDSGNKGEN